MRTPENDRRRFLQLAAAGAGIAAQPGLVSSLQAQARGAVKITEARPIVAAPNTLFVLVRASDGSFGLGECSPMNPRVEAAFIEHSFRDLLLGADPFDTSPLYENILYRRFKLGPQGALSESYAGVDQALWDLKGKILGQPVWRLLGGRFRERIPVYFSYGWDRKATPSEIGKLMGAAAQRGYGAVKIRMGWSPARLDPPDDPAERILKEIRAAVGPGVDIMFDVNNGYSAARAIEMGRRLREKFGITHYEEPTPQYDYAAMAEVARAVEAPVAAGEHEYTLWQFKDLITQGRPAIVQPDVTKCGGLTPAMQIAALVEAFNLTIVCHNTTPTVGTSAMLHYTAAAAPARARQEFTGERESLNRFFKNRLEFADGCLKTPDAPGLGLEPKLDELLKL